MQLRRDDVVAGALAVLDDTGMDGLTMRKLAAHLGVQAGALYWHFPNKQALLEAMADKLVEGVDDDVVSGPWERQFTELAHRLRRALLAHRDGARVLAGTFVAEPNTLASGTLAMEILHRAGLPAREAGCIAFSVFHFILGHTIEEQAQAELAASGAWEAKRAALSEQSAQETGVRPLDAIMDVPPEERFAYGLTVFINGIRHQLTTGSGGS
ncbi:TetR/AcrR family transcriptional regulator C-terminal domain-containing protein [Actinomadura graeca]|uniref:TetR/AcrR family transcriptional regulator C-terminal domain-containing protein n=1 Tax=Actinomadura graeca TaxID=2750812 RepID=A0ABX8QU44_9ACTN|nr:TetR/AcrR family transcriptional regulator C-terminal domain-containing protein [Actinomadura graeca]QXJ22288.1 TetR/AcrR family transcriptional regulator C-terminal domain-containing protein [Actinomadura graeca]